MPKVALTDQAVKRLKAPETGRTDYFDKGYTGLTLRIGPRSRTWFYMARIGGKLVRHRLGTYPDMGVAAAHDAWRHARDQVHAGKPPRPAPKHRDAIETVVADWLKRDQAENDSHDEVKRVFERNVLPEWGGRLVTSIDKRDVVELLDGVADTGKMAKARNLHALLHRFFRWCAGRDIIPTSPMASLDKPGETVARDRVLSDAEIRAFWYACKALAYPFGPIGQLLLLTGARLREIGDVQWTEIDARDACLRLARDRVKSGKPRLIALPPLAWRILHNGPRLGGCPYVFSTTGRTPVSGWNRMKARLDAETRFNERWTLHDCRRTVRTHLSKKAMGVPYEVREMCLGHVKKGLDRVYDQHDFLDEMHDALAKWTGHVLNVVAGAGRAGSCTATRGDA